MKQPVVVARAECLGSQARQHGLAVELLDLIEMDIRELLTQYGFDGEAIPFVRGSAKQAVDNPTCSGAARCSDELLAALDNSIPDPVRLIEQPFLMPIENVFTIEGRGTVVSGRIETGVIRKHDHVEIVGFADEPRQTVCTEVEAFNAVRDIGSAGENVGCCLRNVDRSEVQRGQVIAASGSITTAAWPRLRAYSALK